MNCKSIYHRTKDPVSSSNPLEIRLLDADWRTFADNSVFTISRTESIEWCPRDGLSLCETHILTEGPLCTRIRSHSDSFRLNY